MVFISKKQSFEQSMITSIMLYASHKITSKAFLALKLNSIRLDISGTPY